MPISVQFLILIIHTLTGFTGNIYHAGMTIREYFGLYYA